MVVQGNFRVPGGLVGGAGGGVGVGFGFGFGFWFKGGLLCLQGLCGRVRRVGWFGGFRRSQSRSSWCGFGGMSRCHPAFFARLPPGVLQDFVLSPRSARNRRAMSSNPLVNASWVHLFLVFSNTYGATAYDLGLLPVWHIRSSPRCKHNNESDEKVMLLLLPRRRVVLLQEHYDTSEALSCLLHSSIALHKDIEARPLSLEKCLDTFTAQEDIKEVGGVRDSVWAHRMMPLWDRLEKSLRVCGVEGWCLLLFPKWFCFCSC